MDKYNLLKIIELVAKTYNNFLNLNDCGLTDLPVEIAQLQNLTELNLSSNQLTSLPAEIAQLQNLTELDLSSNQLTSLPAEIAQLQNLTELDLSSNQLTSLPAEIAQLQNLTELNLSSNQLTSLPVEIAQLQNLTRLYISGNQLPIPPEILKNFNSPRKIIDYYLNLLKNQRKPLDEAKVLSVGQGKVGKTSLIKRLLKNDFNPQESKTEGIDIQPWHIAVKAHTVQLNLWDFGGQEIMHATHQFFLTKRSLYLLVLDARLGDEENRIEYWLKIIQSFGGNSPIIIVGNQIDEHPLDIDRRGLQQKYPQIQAILETSCKTGAGIPELRTAITTQIAQLDHVFDLLPEPWFQIKQRLEQDHRDYIPYTAYETLCDAESVTDPQSQATLIGFLHDLGVVLNFRDDPRLEDTHVLNPEWVTNGVYRILNDRELIIEHKGILNRDHLNRILDPIAYPRNKHLFIIDMMHKFELCFPLDDNNEQFLIPDLLTKEEPYTGDWPNPLAFEYHYNVLPNSIISRFIVRMNQYVHQKTYWRTGVVLAYGNNKALVKSDREDKIMSIRVIGSIPTRRSLLAIIRSQFEAIHQTIKGIEAKAKVPLPARPDIVVDYQHLLNLEHLGEATFIPEGLTERVSIKELLNGIETEQQRYQAAQDLTIMGAERSRSLPPKSHKREVFISYAWGGDSETLTNQLDQALQAKGITITRDKRDIGYTANIRDFMAQIGQGQAVIVVISKKYLESQNCMFELVQIEQHGEVCDRIFPIILSDAQIYDPIHRIQYLSYWEQKIEALQTAIDTLKSSANLPGIHADIDLFTEIRRVIDKSTDMLRDMNALTPEMHQNSDFEQLYQAIETKLSE